MEETRAHARHQQRKPAVRRRRRRRPPRAHLGDASKPIGFAYPQSFPHIDWKATPVSAPGDARPIVNFSHGLGLGDINSDGRKDVFVTDGWWERSRSTHERPVEVPHRAPFGKAHAPRCTSTTSTPTATTTSSVQRPRRGIWWHEQRREGEAPAEPAAAPAPALAPSPSPPTWKTHLIDESIAQTHALILADMNGDGLPDLVTGKRYYAHNGRDPGEDEPPEIAWFELSRSRLPDGTSAPPGPNT